MRMQCAGGGNEMADIDIVPKRRSSTWIWILMAIIVAIVVMWMLMGREPASSIGGVSAPGHPVIAVVSTSTAPIAG